MNFTKFVQGHLKEYRQGLLGLSLLLAFFVSGTVAVQAQGLSTVSGFAPNKSTTLAGTAKNAADAIDALQAEINQLRASFFAQTGTNEAIWDIKITYFEAVRKRIKDVNKTAAAAIIEEVDLTLNPTAARYVGITKLTLQAIVDEAVDITHD